MDALRWERVESILDAALTTEPTAWPALLDSACSGDPELRRQVEGLLARLDNATGFLASPPASVAAALVAEGVDYTPRSTPVGRRFGAYRIVREIGRGGMSRVFLAERADGAFEQQVAIKLLRPGMDSELDRGRFRAERQILASLNHPNIARLLDGGISPEGEPFLVMEHVDGSPIDAYCEQNRTSIHDRLRLFAKVARAVQYAHTNLIVHRDLKPSNVLVTPDGEVKLLDFGVAKLIQPGLSKAATTQAGHRWFTPEYAAPEQLAGGSITTLTDVYQLGVVLYRLLSGRLPFTGSDRSLVELESAILSRDPPPPSLISLDEGSARNALRGDLDAVVLKALRKEPGERYGAAEEMALDIERYLRAEPVLARRGGRLYQLRRLVRRRRIETTAGVLAFAAIVGGSLLAVSQASRAESERRLAAAAARESEAVTAFVMNLFQASDPTEARGDTLTARDLVRRAHARAEKLRGQPLVQARMFEATARLYSLLGEPGEAHTLLVRALALHAANGGERNLEAATILGELATVLDVQGRVLAADSAARRALAIEQSLLHANHPAVAARLQQIARMSVARGDLAAAEEENRRALAIRLRAVGPEDSLTAISHMALGAVLRRRGRLAESERELRTAAAILERALGPEDAEVGQALAQVAYVLHRQGNREAETEALFRRVLVIRQRALGEAHPLVASSVSDLGVFLSETGRHEEAIPLGRQHVDLVRRAFGAEHRNVMYANGVMAFILARGGEYAEAERLYRDNIAQEKRLSGPDHVNLTGHEFDLARLLITRGDYAAAEPLLHDAVRISTATLGQDHMMSAMHRGELGKLLLRTGRYAAADTILHGALATMETHTTDEDPHMRELRALLDELETVRSAAATAAH